MLRAPKPSATEEEAFMAKLFTDPPVTPTRHRGLSTHKLSPRPPPSGREINASPNDQLYSAGQVDLEEEISGWDWDALSDYVPSPKKFRDSAKNAIRAEAGHQDATFSIVPNYVKELRTRCIVQTVMDTWNGDVREKRIQATTEPELEPRSIVLRDDWVFTDVHEGDVVNIIGPFDILADGEKCITVTNLENFLIHHPDTLLTPSLLASAPNCQRRPLVTALVRAPSPPTPALIYGTILHDVVQRCLQERRWDAQWIEAHVDTALSMAFGELVRAGVTVSVAKDEILRRAAGVETFGGRYIGDEPKPEAILSDTRAARGETALLAISSLYDIEEDIWSPTYGLRGKLDASVQAVVARNPGSLLTHPAPFEIKTGRAVAGLEHRAQTMLYSLLMQERYGDSVDRGLLYYTQSEEVISVPVTRLELRALIGVRNAIAEWMARRFRGRGLQRFTDDSSFLPPTINNERLCGRCYALDSCMLYRRAVENVTDEASAIADIYAEKTGHLTQSHADFFKKWERLIALEEQDMMRFKKELWTLDARERETLGRCFAEMTLDTSSTPETSTHASTNKIHGFTYRFHRSNDASAESLLNGYMAAGDAVTVSVDPDLFALCRGFILELGPRHVILGVDHTLNVEAIQARLSKRQHQPLADAEHSTTTIKFRIDKDEFSAGMGRVRENLASLFYVGGDTTRLRLVVDLAPPIFDVENDLLTRARASSRCRTLARSLNANQTSAVEKVLCSHDYTMILGMPGTGKTTVVAHLIRMLVEMGKTVLLSAYTHSAVDTILTKLEGADFGILRLGNVDKVHPSARKYHLSTRRQPTTIEEFERQFMTPRVVATTALSIDHELFSRRIFDYCIVDEASQITLPTCLGPLRFSTKFVLVGDHYQLPPLVRNREARKGGLDVSLFRRLSEAHPHAVVELTQQYRMSADIMLLSNKLVYNDRLSCGNQMVANQSLILPDNTLIQQIHTLTSTCRDLCWMSELMLPTRKAVFVDTDHVPATESQVGDLVQNVTEAVLVQQFTECLIRSDIHADQIGVITLYRQQIKLLSHLLSSRPDVEILTADRSQGRDKDCIIISMVRSNEDGTIGDLVKDWRRMNVAFTRARSKLVIFGSRSTLARTPLLESFFRLMEGEGWILQLPSNAHEVHAGALSQGLSTKRKIHENCVMNPSPEKEGIAKDLHRGDSGKRRRISPNTGVLRGRPILKDVFNDIIDLT